jgi:hypothetical protein
MSPVSGDRIRRPCLCSEIAAEPGDRAPASVTTAALTEGGRLRNYLQIEWPFTSATILPGGQAGLDDAAGCAAADVAGRGGVVGACAGLIAVCPGCSEGAAGLIAVCSECSGCGEGAAGLIAKPLTPTNAVHEHRYFFTGRPNSSGGAFVAGTRESGLPIPWGGTCILLTTKVVVK